MIYLSFLTKFDQRNRRSGEGGGNLFKKSKKLHNKQAEEAFRVIYDLFHERVHWIAYHMTRDLHLSQDILQETFIKAFRRIEDVVDGKKMGAWLSVIATNTAIDYLRKRNRRNEFPDQDVIVNIDDPQQYAPDIAKEVELRLEIEHVRNEIEKLDLEYKQALLLRYFVGLSYMEMAEMIGVNEGTIKSRVHRAKQRLKRNLQEQASLGQKGAEQ